MTIRFFILSAHYRSTVDFSNDALKASQKGLERLMNGLNDLERVPVAKPVSYTHLDVYKRQKQENSSLFTLHSSLPKGYAVIFGNEVKGVKDRKSVV